MNLKYINLSILLYISIISCSTEEKGYDATGSFEAIERIISAEATGKILSLNIEEGQTLQINDTIGQIDYSNLLLQSDQIQASVNAIGQKTNNANPQIDILKAQYDAQRAQVAAVAQQIKVLDKEINRFTSLVQAKAAPQKQLDDLIGQKSILQKQLEANQTQSKVIQSQIQSTKASVDIQNRSILSEVEPNRKRLEIIEKQMSDAQIINSYPGTVITKYAFDGEFTSIGKPLYKIADLSTITLRAYITGNQLPLVKLNDQVTILTDDGSGGFNEKTGTISWISSKAEFTPKTIQTKAERANLVYAIKVSVENDGSYKIGMYGEIKFQ